MALGFKFYWDEAWHYIDRTTRMIQGKTLQIALRTAMGGGAASVASDLANPVRGAIGLAEPVATSTLNAGQIIMSSTGGLVSIGIGAGIDAYLNHQSFKHSQRELCALYRPQIASLVGKEPKDVGVADLKSVAATNPSLQNEIKRHRRERTVKNIAAIAGTVVAFFAVFAAVTLFPPLAGLAAGAAAGGLLSGAGLAYAAVAGGIGYATLQLSRRALGAVGAKVFGIDEPSVEDKIRSMSKQHRKEQAIVPEQVMDVFVAANPELAAEVKAQFGKEWSKLPLAEKRAATAQHAETLQTPQIAASINEGRMNVRELTFRVHGQDSGVYPEDPWQEKVKDFAQEHLDPLGEKIGHLREEAVDKFQRWRENREQSKLQDDVAKAIEEGRPMPDKAEEIGNETYWRNLINRERAAATEKSPQGPARA
jgi:phosphoribosylcarboxyaminoimidazole (NCAIR) mutase